MIVVLFLAPRCSFPFGATLWSPVSTHIQPSVNLPYEHRIARIPRHDTDPTMWDEKNLRTGMTWLKQASAIGRFRRPSALEFSGLQRGLTMFFPTCQVRVVRFYVSCLLLLPRPPLLLLLSSSSSSSSLSSLSSLSSSRCPRRPRCPPRPPAQLRLAIHSVRCRNSTTTIHAQCSLPDLNHGHPRPVFPAGPQPRVSTPSVPCRTSTTTIHAQCSLPDLNREYPRQVFPAGPHVGRYGTKNVQKKVRKHVRRYAR